MIIDGCTEDREESEDGKEVDPDDIFEVSGLQMNDIHSFLELWIFDAPSLAEYDAACDIGGAGCDINARVKSLSILEAEPADQVLYLSSYARFHKVLTDAQFSEDVQRQPMKLFEVVIVRM